MDFNIRIIGDGPAPTYSQAGQPQSPWQSPPQMPPVPTPPPMPSWNQGQAGFGGAPTPNNLGANLAEGARQHALSVEDRSRMHRQFLDEYAIRQRQLEVLKERLRFESPALEAARLHEEDVLLRQRMLDVTRERHRIEGAAADEARMQLEQQKEAKDWQQRVNAERRKQDPASAFAEDAGALGGLLGQISGGRGMGGMAAKWLQMMPQLREQFGGVFESLLGAASGGQSGAAATAQKAAQAASSQAGAAGAGGGVSGAMQALGGMAGKGGMAAAEGAAAGAGAGGALGGIAGAAGPAGIAIMAAQEITKVVQDGIKEQTRAWQLSGERFQQLIRDEGWFEGLASRADEAADSLGQIGPAWTILGEKFKQQIEMFRIAGRIQEEFIRRGERLEDFSGGLASARAQAETRAVLGDIREANELGASIGRLVDAQSKTTDALREISAPLKKIAVEGLSIPNELTALWLDQLRDMLKDKGILPGLNGNIDAIFKFLRERLGLPVNDDNNLDALVSGHFGRNLDNFRPANDPGANVGAAPIGPPVPPGGP